MTESLAAQVQAHVRVVQEKIAKSPAQYLHHHELGILLGAQNHFEQAIAAFEQAIRLCPTFGEAWFNRGMGLQLSGRLYEAYDSAVAAYRLTPGFDAATL
jgi:Flp pilus assembly protein TadD